MGFEKHKKCFRLALRVTFWAQTVFWTFEKRTPGLDIIKEHERIFFSIEQSKGIMNVVSIEQNLRRQIIL